MSATSFGASSAKISRGRVARYLRTESGAAVLLVIVTVVALAWANSPLSDAYFELWHLDVGFDFGPLGLHMDLHHWVNDGLMVVFFFLIGLEVRQEFAHGSLRDRSRARLALIAGVAGVVLPALVYVLIVGLAGSEGLHGWGGGGRHRYGIHAGRPGDRRPAAIRSVARVPAHPDRGR
ncbi:Na+/H+ antiporter NhaA [Pseudomonas aeruginosa]